MTKNRRIMVHQTVLFVSLCGIDIYSKYAGVVPSKYKEGITIINAIQKMLDESERESNIPGFKLNEITIDQRNHGCKIMI